jgi:signal transduction histidine kinase
MGSDRGPHATDFTGLTTADLASLTAALERAERECRDLRVRNAQLEQSEAILAAQIRLSALGADIGLALTGVRDLQETLQACAQAVVDRLDAAFARIWTLNEAQQVLELRASAGLYTHLNGPHGRVPVGKFKVGLIALERKPHLTNHVIGDSRISDQEWARRMGMVAFAGFPLMFGSNLLGVLAVFSRRPFSPSDSDALATVAHSLSIGIARMGAIDALRDSDTRHRQRAEELAHLASALQRSNHELDAFAYAASHDLRAPLRGIANLAQWIEEDLQGTLRDETREMLGLMRSRMHRMEALIEGILQYSRAGRAHDRPSRVDVRRVVQEIVELLALGPGTVVMPSELPVLIAERPPLHQVFQNLIGNAVKHGGPRVQVTIHVRDAGPFWEFSVEDNGPGIPAEFHDRIWDIFQTLEPRDKVEGTGIGLSLVKKIVESQGGTVFVESARGAGATFGFTWRKTTEPED